VNKRVDEIRKAVLLVYSQLASYAITVIGAFTLFSIAFDLAIPVLGVLIFSTLVFVHIVAYWMLQAPLREARLIPHFLFAVVICVVFLLASVLLLL